MCPKKINYYFDWKNQQIMEKFKKMVVGISIKYACWGR